MSCTKRTSAGGADGEGPLAVDLRIIVNAEGDRCLVHVTGELDMATRNQLFVAATAGNHPAMAIDLAGVTFMDCSGYGCLVASRTAIEQSSRTLTITGATGQPARLLELIGTVDRHEANPGSAVGGQTKRRFRGFELV